MITILTTTFNRSHTLERLYKSLLRQTSSHFEWLIIDDGSSDNTKSLISYFNEQAKINTRYIYQNNAGKHIAINNGVQHARGNIIFIVDSDDAISDDAIATIDEKLQQHDSHDLVGLCFRKCFFDGCIVGNAIELHTPLVLSPNEAGRLFAGDLAYIFKKEAMSEHPFPAVKGEFFVPELYIWNKINDTGKILFFPQKSIYHCEYLEDGYSMNFQLHLKRNPHGFGIYYRDQIFRKNPVISKCKYALRLLQCSFYKLLTMGKQ